MNEEVAALPKLKKNGDTQQKGGHHQPEQHQPFHSSSKIRSVPGSVRSNEINDAAAEIHSEALPRGTRPLRVHRGLNRSLWAWLSHKFGNVKWNAGLCNSLLTPADRLAVGVSHDFFDKNDLSGTLVP